jgi:hypothetical protein
MKTYCLVIIMSIFSWNTAVGEIKNGYGTDIRKAEESMRYLTSLLRDNSNLHKYKREIKESLKAVADHIAYYRLTEQLLEQFRAIAPDLYDEINSIKDKKGRTVDVHIKFVPLYSTELNSWGSTYIGQSDSDHDAYVSEYGENTVSVKIWTVKRALLVLSHELGHVKYQVPHLASYLEFLREEYTDLTGEFDRIGHLADDPSGINARHYEKRFRSNFSRYIKRTNDNLETPLAILKKTMRTMKKDIVDGNSVAGLHPR